MTVCIFGDYKLEYNRTKLLYQALDLNGVTIIQCHVGRTEKWRYFKLWRQFRKIRKQCDAVLLGFSADRFLPCATRLVVGNKILFWDIQYSCYDNWVFDRHVVDPKSVKAKLHWLVDWINCRLVDRILLDTDEHFNYFIEEFGLKKRKMVKVGSGADREIFKYQKQGVSDGIFRVEYHGKYIPVQGVDVLIRAAKLLEHEPNINFTLIGHGQEVDNVRKLAHDLGVKNVTFLPYTPITQISPYIAKADICMGLIGDIPRVERNIPTKLYEAASVGRASINADTRAIREIFTDGYDVVLVKRGDAKDLAEKILNLSKNPDYARMLGENVHKTFIEKCDPADVGKQLINGFNEFM